MSKFRINLDVHLKDLSGEEIKESQKLSKQLAQLLVTEAPKDEKTVFKYTDWGYALWNDGEVELDTADRDTLKDYISASERFTALIKRQIIDIIKGVSENASTKPQGEAIPKKKKD